MAGAADGSGQMKSNQAEAVSCSQRDVDGIGRKSKAEGVAFERPVKVANNKQETARTEGAPKPGNGLASGRETPSKRHEKEGVSRARGGT